jgi:putative ABC transport system substrate-binding protein
VRRRIRAGLGSAAATPVLAPLSARAQQAALPVIGFLNSGSLSSRAFQVHAFHQGLNETGYVEGQSVAIEYRWAHGRNELLPALAADLVRRRVHVIAAFGDPAVVATRNGRRFRSSSWKPST